jgi:hypothetical protein
MAAEQIREKQVWVPRMLRYLEEKGGEAPKSAVIEEGMRHVPGGMAYRVGFQKRGLDSAYRNFGVQGELRKSDRTSLIRAGANKIVCNSLYYERKAGRIEEFDGPDGTKWLRLVVDSMRMTH